MDVRLTIIRGAQGRPTFLMRGPSLIIGRQKGCTVRIPASSVSRQHCRLIHKAGLLCIEDLHSTNGTFLNGERIRARETLHPGDKLVVGPVTFRIDFTPLPTAKKRADGTTTDDSSAELILEPIDAEESTESQSPVLEELQPIQEFDLPLPMMEEEPTPDLQTLNDASAEPMHLPEGEELRALLAELEEDEPEKK